MTSTPYDISNLPDEPTMSHDDVTLRIIVVAYNYADARAQAVASAFAFFGDSPHKILPRHAAAVGFDFVQSAAAPPRSYEFSFDATSTAGLDF